jgi:hypothetical protein
LAAVGTDRLGDLPACALQACYLWLRKTRQGEDEKGENKIEGVQQIKGKK